jgi:hypothetical protein
MTKIIALSIGLIIVANTQTDRKARDESQLQDQNSSVATAKLQTATQVTIAVGAELGIAKDLFKVGEAILVTITMTNSSTAPQNVCLSANLYQNLPLLTKDGEPVPIMKWTSEVRTIAQRDRTCQDINLPEKVVIGPNTQKSLDWFTLVDSTVPTGVEAWYETLKPGKYELSLQRRLDCCDGVMVQSNKTSFTIVP